MPPVQSKKINDESTSVKRTRRTKLVKPSDVVIDMETGVTEVSAKVAGRRKKRQSTPHEDFIRQFRKKQDDKYVANLVARGLTVYSPEDLFETFGMEVDDAWSREHVQEAAELGAVALPLSKLRKRTGDFEQKYSAVGRKAMKTFMTEAYRIYLLAEQSSHSYKIYSDLRQILKRQGTGVHKDSPGASVIMRGVFAHINSKQVHVYGRALEAAMKDEIAVDKFAQFIDNEGGFEKLRAKQAKLSASDRVATAAEVEQKGREFALKKLAFARTEPFLKVPITRDNFFRIKSGEKAKERKETRSFVQYNMVVMLAALDERDTSNLDLYWSVLMTPALERAVLKAVSETFVNNADWVARFRKWEKEQEMDATKT